jgi:carbamate kinase
MSCTAQVALGGNSLIPDAQKPDVPQRWNTVRQTCPCLAGTILIDWQPPIARLTRILLISEEPALSRPGKPVAAFFSRKQAFQFEQKGQRVVQHVGADLLSLSSTVV